MKENNKIRISIGLMIISFILIFISIGDNRKIDKSYLELSSENTNLNKRLEKARASQKSLETEISTKKSKIEGIDSEITKFGVLSDKKAEISDLKNELSNTYNRLQDNKFDFYYSRFDNANTFIPLEGFFFNPDRNTQDGEDNIIFLPTVINSYINENLNYKISRNNFSIIQNLGIIEYIENGDNYLAKSILLNDNSNSDTLKKRNLYLLALNKRYLNTYKNIYDGIDSSYDFTNSRIDILDKLLKDESIVLEEKDLDVLNHLNAFCIDMLNSYAKEVAGLNVTKNDDIRQLKRDDFVLMSEKIDSKEINITFFDKNNGKIFEVNDKID